jgi:hypothetical protein
VTGYGPADDYHPYNNFACFCGDAEFMPLHWRMVAVILRHERVCSLK